MLTRLIVYIAYYLKTSKNYQQCKRFFYNLLENPQSKLKSYFDFVMIALVLISVFFLVYEVDNKATPTQLMFERALISVFIFEYMIRAWIFNDNHKIILDYYEKTQYLHIPFSLLKVLKKLIAKKIAYVLSPLAIIDLLAILPSYRSLRFFRVLLIFRIFKLFRYFDSLKLFAEVITSKRFELYTLALFVGFLLFVGSIGIYLFENHANGGLVNGMFDALYLSVVTLSTVGFGDIVPKTVGGRLVVMALILSGLAVLAFFTSIIVTAFSERLLDLRESQVYAELNRYDNFVIICGFGRVGRHIAQQLHLNKQQFVIIDSSEAKVKKAKKLGYLVIHADASNNSVLTKAGINNGANAILCTTGDDVTNVYITLTSRYLNKNIRIITRAANQDNVKKLYQAGANNVIHPYEIAGMVVAEYIGQPVAFEAILGIIRQESHIGMETLPVYSDGLLAGKSLAEIGLLQRKLLLVGVISENPIHRMRKNSYSINNQYFYFNPELDFVLQPNDLLVVFGRDVAIEHFHDQIEKRQLIKRPRK
jgi:voltage-gated potassium channel